MRQNFLQLLGNSTATSSVDAWIVAGQSNTDGRVPISTPPSWMDETYTVPSSLMFNDITNAFAPWIYGVNSGGDNNSGSDWAYDSTAIYQYGLLNGRTQHVIKNSVGGTAIGFNPESSRGCWNTDFASISGRKLLQELEQKFNIASQSLGYMGKQLDVKGILWHQGESDSGSEQNIADYYANLTSVIAYIRSFVGNPNLPFIFGTISHISGQYNATIEDAHIQIASEDANAHLVDMSTGTLLDPYHFDAASSESLGNQMYTIMAGL